MGTRTCRWVLGWGGGVGGYEGLKRPLGCAGVVVWHDPCCVDWMAEQGDHGDPDLQVWVCVGGRVWVV